jgi:hypothetical protein
MLMLLNRLLTSLIGRKKNNQIFRELEATSQPIPSSNITVKRLGPLSATTYPNSVLRLLHVSVAIELGMYSPKLLTPAVL